MKKKLCLVFFIFVFIYMFHFSFLYPDDYKNRGFNDAEMADGVPGAVCQKVKTDGHVLKNSFTSQPAESQTKFLRTW